MYNKPNLIAKPFALFLLFLPVFMTDGKISKVIAQDNLSAHVMFDLSSLPLTDLRLAQTGKKKNTPPSQKQDDNPMIWWFGGGGIILISSGLIPRRSRRTIEK